ncbi:MAG TPA: hypothetical protein VFQ00_14775 [Terriglobales bacterium]|nr:hypothetical protein [Terriglobales bacterium]
MPGEKLRYEPVKVPESLKEKARVSLIVVPVGSDGTKQLQVLPAQPVSAPAEWVMTQRASAIGVVFGPHGIDTKKVASLVQKHPEIVTKLANYAEETSRVEALVQTLSDYEDSAPDSKGLQSVLDGFQSQYGVKLPSIDPKSASTQQALSIVKALAPTVASNDPLPSRDNVVGKASGLAGSVAASYFGAPVALAIGGAQLVEGLRTSLFPPTDFVSAFAQSETGNSTNLCTAKPLNKKSKAKVDYVWMSRISDNAVPEVTLAANTNIPLGTDSSVTVKTATEAQRQELSRVRDWHLVSGSREIPIPVKIQNGTGDDALSVNLQQAKLTPGQYQLAAKWDWTLFNVGGNLDVRALGNIANAKVTPQSQDALIAGAGPVQVQLAGTDFEFVQSVALLDPSNPKNKPQSLEFTLPKGKAQGEQTTMQAQIDTASLHAGEYKLAIQQTGGAAHDLAITVHPPNPQLAQTPMRVNVGEPQQTIQLHGTHLERIEKLTSPDASWTLSPVGKQVHEEQQRTATVKLQANAKKGDTLPVDMYVAGLHAPLKINDVLDVAGPRPRITAATKSFAAESGVELRNGELPAGTAASFALQVQNVDGRPEVGLACKEAADTRHALQLAPGDKNGSAALDFAGTGNLFLSVDPGSIGDSGCELVAQITESQTGTSDPFDLGEVVRVPRIDKLSIGDDKVDASTYAGSITGSDLQLIEKIGWSAKAGDPVQGIPTPIPGQPQEQTLKIAVPWPPPAPHAPLYVWLRGENEARATNTRY